MTDPSRPGIAEAKTSEQKIPSTGIAEARTPEQEISEKFAPVVWLHKDDEFRPSSVDWYLKRASLEYKNNKKKIIEEKNVTAQLLIEQQVGSDYSDFTKQDKNRNQKFNLKIENIPENMNGDSKMATCYVHIRNKATFDIQYWFFYPYNGAIGGSGAHEGDWEHITVRFTTPNPTGQGHVEKVFFSRHDEKVWIESKKVEFEGNRPVIYSAFHTHANYSTPYQGLIDECNKGVKWETWTTGGGLKFLEDDPANESSKGPLCWNRFNGNWGGSKSMVSTPGIRLKKGWDAD